MMTQHITTILRKIIPQTQLQTIEDVYPCLVGQADRNAARIAQIKKDMGEKYILHPSHMKKRLKKARPV